MSIKIQKTVGIAISQTSNLLNSSINKKIKDFGIAIEQRMILELIQKEKQIKQSDLTKALEKDKTTISRTLSTLEKKQYIIKEKIDNKNHLIKLSDLGEKVMKRSQKEVSLFREKIVSEFTKEELDNLYCYLERINKIVK